MKKFIILFIVLFLGLTSVKALDFKVATGVCVDDACSYSHSPNNSNEKYYIPSDKLFKLAINWDTSVIDGPSLSYVQVTYTLPRGVSKGNTTISNSYYTLEGSTNGVKFTAPNPIPEDGKTVNYEQDLVLPANSTSSPSGLFKIEVTVEAYNVENARIYYNKATFNTYVLGGYIPVYDNNAKLSGVSVSSGSLSPAFNNSVKSYTIYTSEQNITFTLKPESNKTTLYYGGRSVNEKTVEDYKNNPKAITGAQTYPVEFGSNSFVFYTRSEKYEHAIQAPTDGTYLYNSYPSPTDADYRMFEFNVIRQDNRSQDNTLKTLSISEINIDFKPEVKTYSATVKNEVDSVTITSTLTDNKSQYVKGFGNRTESLSEGQNTIYIKVKSESGVENVYTINIEREKSDNNLLKEITVNDKIISIVEDKLKYEIHVDNDVTTAEVKAIAEHNDAIVDISEIPSLEEGDNEVNITVTAPNGEKKNYVLNIKRDGLVSSNSSLKELTIKGYEIDFNSHKTEYTLRINDEKTLDITAKTEHEKAKVAVNGNKDLKNGSVVEVKVTAEDGSETIYKIKIEKEEKKSGISIIIPIIGIILVAGAIGAFVFLKKKKQPKGESTLIGGIKEEAKPEEEKKEEKTVEEPEIKPTPQTENTEAIAITPTPIVPTPEAKPEPTPEPQSEEPKEEPPVTEELSAEPTNEVTPEEPKLEEKKAETPVVEEPKPVPPTPEPTPEPQPEQPKEETKPEELPIEEEIETLDELEEEPNDEIKPIS